MTLESTLDSTERTCWNPQTIDKLDAIVRRTFIWSILLKVKYNEEILADMLNMAKEHGFMDEVSANISNFYDFLLGGS